MAPSPPVRAIRRRAAAPAAEPLHGQSAAQLLAENEELRQALQTIELSLQRFSEHYDLAPFGYLTVDGAGMIREVNHAACAMLGLERLRVLGGLLRLLVRQSDRSVLAGHLTACRRLGRATTQLSLRRSDGGTVSVELHTRRGAGHRPDCFTIAMLELTEWDRERGALVAAAQDALEHGSAKSDLLAMISHELRTPLTPILAAVAALEQRTNDSAELDNLCQMIRRNVTTQARLIDDLLDATRISRGKMALHTLPVEIDQVAKDAIDQARPAFQTKGVQVVVALDGRGALVEGDPLRLGQVFSNLLGNALKYTEPGREVVLRSWRSGDSVAVEVSDSGAGIASEALPRLFSPFEQADRRAGSQGGLGLGLAISKGIVDLHRGRITAGSAGLGKGARFVVELPVVPARRSKGEDGKQGARILLVEDNPDTAEALCLALDRKGYRVAHAPSVTLALQVDLRAIDLVVSDLRLADGDGRHLLKRLRARGPVTAIALSGYGGDGDLESSKAAGFFAHLIKPVPLELLTETIERALAEKNRS